MTNSTKVCYGVFMNLNIDVQKSKQILKTVRKATLAATLVVAVTEFVQKRKAKKQSA